MIVMGVKEEEVGVEGFAEDMLWNLYHAKDAERRRAFMESTVYIWCMV